MARKSFTALFVAQNLSRHSRARLGYVLSDEIRWVQGGTLLHHLFHGCTAYFKMNPIYFIAFRVL